MHRIDNSTAVVSLPAPDPVGPNPDYYFTKGNPGGGTPATTVDQDWANAVQEELCQLIESLGGTLDKTNPAQLKDLIGGGAKIVFDPGSALTTWTITHNFNSHDYDVYVRDDGSPAKKIEPDEIEYTDLDTCTIRFNEAQDGKAFLTKFPS